MSTSTIHHATLPVSLSLVADSDTQCNYPHCAPFFYTTPSSLDVPLAPLTSAKYLGSYITPTSSSISDVNFRCSQSSSAFKTVDPFFRHPLISQRFKLRVYTQIVQSILLHGSESQIYSPAQITKIDSLHYKALRQFFQIKSLCYHRVLSPADSPCSNEFLLSLAYPVLPWCIPSSMRISDSRIKMPWSYPPSPILSRIYSHVQSFSLPPYNFFPFFRRSPFPSSFVTNYRKSRAMGLSSPQNLK